MTGLTGRQAEVIARMVEHFEQRGGVWPSVREIAIAIGIKQNGLNAVSRHLVALQRKGFVEHETASKARCYRVVRLADGQRVEPRLVPVDDPGERTARPEGWSL